MPARFQFPALATGLVAALLATPATAELYKWVDEKGVVNYSSTPPPGRPAKELPQDGSGLSVVPAPPPPPPAAPRTHSDERVEKLEETLQRERAARQAQEQAAEDSLRAAIAQCEQNRGVDCEENPYQYADGGYGYGYGSYPDVRRPIRRHPDDMPVVKPRPATHPKIPPKPARTGPAASHPSAPRQ